MPTAAELLDALDRCQPGLPGWHDYEDACMGILTHLFVPPLQPPTIQARSYSGIDRRDAIFPNRNMDQVTIWGQLRHELGARLVLFEFKNYDTSDIGKDDVDQLRNYLTNPMGKLAFLVGSKEAHDHARLRRNQVYTQEGKVIIFLTSDLLKEMVHMKERGDDPALLVMEQLELFYMQHE